MAIFYRKLPKFEYVLPKTINEALSFLAKNKGKARVLAGGTDLIPMLKSREVEAPAFVVDLKGISGLDKISYSKKAGLKIGALATISAIGQSEVIKEYYPSLAEAALTMASPQVRNRGTFVGNICSAVPSADSVPALLALGASLTLKSPNGERTVALEKFFKGPRKTALKPGELVTEILVPNPAPDTRQVYLKLSPRHAMDLAVVGVAAAGRCENGVCKDVKIGLGAVAPTPVRAPMAEKMLQGKKVTKELIDQAAKHAITQCSPIDDHRASQEYRCDMVYVMTKRALTQVLEL